MSDAYKQLGQATPAINMDETTATALYTVPAGKQAALDLLIDCFNPGTGACQVKVTMAPAGAAYNVAHIFMWQFPFPMGRTVLRSSGILLGPADVIRVNSSIATITFQAFGIESDSQGGKILSQMNIPAAGAWQDLYTVPAGKKAIVTLLNAASSTGTRPVLSASIAPGGAAAVQPHIFWWNQPVQPVDCLQERDIPMSAGDILRVTSDLAGISVTAFGFEVPA